MEASEEIQKQAKKHKGAAVFTAICCSYWMINTTLGLYTIYKYPELKSTHPNLYQYIRVFSLKWFLAFFISLALLISSCFLLKVCCRAEHVLAHSLGAFPIIYVFVIFMSYMFALYYGIYIVYEIYSPYDDSY